MALAFRAVKYLFVHCRMKITENPRPVEDGERFCVQRKRTTTL